MIIDRTHTGWAGFTVIATLIAGVLYFITFAGKGSETYLHESVGGTPLGLTYGIISALIFLFAAILGWRRNHPALRVGRMQIWLKGHIWLTILTIPLILMHAGFKLGGPMTVFLLSVYTLVMISGFYGLALQHVLPSIMKEKLPNEVVFEQIPFVIEKLATEVQAIREDIIKNSDPQVPETEKNTSDQPEENEESEKTEEKPPLPLTPTPLIEFLDQEVIPYLTIKPRRRSQLKKNQSSDDLFRACKINTEKQWHAQIERCREIVNERRDLALQTRFQHWLHFWILFHAPLSFLLIILTAWHAIVTLIDY